MLRNMIFCAAVALVVTLLMAGEASAWGVRSVGYTHVGPNGVYHAGRTAVAGPYGYHVGGVDGYRTYGGYGGTYRYGATAGYGGLYPRTYGAGYTGGYRYVTPYGAGVGGVYRGW